MTPYLVNKNLTRKKKQPDWYTIRPTLDVEKMSILMHKAKFHLKNVGSRFSYEI